MLRLNRSELVEGEMLLPEDERQCALCKTNIFMSALTIKNGRDDQEIVYLSLDVDPSNLILRYRCFFV